MYKLIISDINANADNSYFNQWLKDNYFEIFKGFSIGSEVCVYFSSELYPSDQEAITNRYESLTVDDTLPLTDIIITYSTRATDGQNYYNNVRGNMALEYNAGTLSIEDANYIETKLIVVTNFLLTGDWATAQYQINNVTVENKTVSAEDTANGFTQERYDSIRIAIDLYVETHY